MPKPLLPSVDSADRVREVAFALLVRDRRLIELCSLAAAGGLDVDTTSAAVDSLASAGWLDLTAGRVSGAAGLSLDTGPHSLTLNGASFRTWCAYDALGIAAALAADAVLETTCGECGAAVVLAFEGGTPDRSGPERLWLAEGGGDLRRSFCAPTVLLCGAEHGSAWAETQGGRGSLLDLVEAARAGAADWAGCADAARRLA
jgi:hypothetical protein